MTPGPDQSAGRQVRVAVLDAQPGRFGQSTRRVLLRAGVEPAIELTSRDPRRFGERAQALRDARPDVVLVPAADRPGADSLVYLAEPFRYGCSSQTPPPTVIVASGDDGAIARASALFSPFPIEVAPDIRADAGRIRVASRLRDLRREGGVLRDDALEELAVRAAEVRAVTVLVLDVTGSSTSFVRAEPTGKTTSVHARPLGIGSAADRVVAGAALERVRKWIPWQIDAPSLLERVFDRSRRQDVDPPDRESLAVEIALAREAVVHAVADAHEAGVGAALRPAGLALLVGRLATLDAAQAQEVVADVLGPPAPAQTMGDPQGRLVTYAIDAVSRADHAHLDEALRTPGAPAGS